MLVSVVVPAYNSIYVRDAIVSIVNQTHRDLDVLVVDDGSPSDAIKTICDEFPDVRYIRQANAGPSAARNNGIRHAKGDWVAFLDDDDVWLPNKIEKQLCLIESSSAKDQIGLVYTGQYMIQETSLLGSKVDEANGMIYQYLLFGNFIGTCSSVLIPKHVFEKVGYYDESLICSQDFDLYLRIARQFEIYSVPEPLIKYRTRPDQISKNPTLNNADDNEILRRQEQYVDAALFGQVKDFHRLISSLRYKQTAYDALFRMNSRGAYWKWLWRSAVEARALPSPISLAYLALTVAPSGLINRVTRMKSSNDLAGAKNCDTSYQNVCKDFVWMGVRRGNLVGKS